MFRRLGGRISGHVDRLVEELYRRRHGACRCDVPGRSSDHRITRLDDPDGGATVLGLQGMVHQASVDALRGELDTLRAPHALFLDFHEAIIVSEARMDLLARLIDGVENVGLSIRVTGISPDHPALRPLKPAD
jgi:hypothetical protein